MVARSSFCLLPRPIRESFVSGMPFVYFYRSPLRLRFTGALAAACGELAKAVLLRFISTNLYLTHELRHYLADSKNYGSDTPED